MADTRDRLAGIRNLADAATQVFVIANVLRCPTSRYKRASVLVSPEVIRLVVSVTTDGGGSVVSVTTDVFSVAPR
jgi:hypothetical protein